MKLKDGFRTRVNEGYGSDFKVVLSVKQPKNLVLHLREGASMPMAVEHSFERDLVAFVARAFWSMNQGAED